MVSPVTSGLPQQIPAANTFQPGGTTETVRQKDNSEQTRAAGTSTAESQRSETRSNARTETVTASARDEDNGQTRARTDRGSVVDLTV